jgi:uncharacterized protein YbcI
VEKYIVSSSSSGPRAEISNAVVGLHRTYFGKGPTKAKTYIQDDVILCVLESGSTQVEQALCAGGKAVQARQARTELLQEAAKKAFCQKLESLTHRQVISFTSGYCPESDVTTLVFLLAK